MAYDVVMTAPLERPKTPLSVIVVGSAVAVLVGLVLLRWIMGFVITLTKIGIAVAIIAFIVIAIGRLVNDED